ncbi:hypothetical protein [Methylovorus mays]|uniref:hypothetical protein n=1 Tax=Methylovorus mays TaxID=184077 RepID=UPI001E2AB95E|nr:hypothetical protein [Methylovorus mays]MCB5206640.1 hypothetical protein [Methylovorus mays]
MSRFSLASLMLLVSIALPLQAQAKAPAGKFTGEDFSGVYQCTGDDAHEGAYTGTVTMTLKPEHSRGSYASYDFKLEVPDYGTYLGHAAANGRHVAMHFGLQDPTTHDYGTGIAVMKKTKVGKWRFHKFYFEPEFKGGNTGLEDCVIK